MCKEVSMKPPGAKSRAGGMYEWDTIKLPSAWKQEC